jgi:hypothetical protein
MATKSRLYKVTTPTAVRLIKTTSTARAIAHAARKEISATIPAQHEVYAMARSGIEIETAGDVDISDETRSAVAQSDLVVEHDYL